MADLHIDPPEARDKNNMDQDTTINNGNQKEHSNGTSDTPLTKNTSSPEEKSSVDTTVDGIDSVKLTTPLDGEGIQIIRKENNIIPQEEQIDATILGEPQTPEEVAIEKEDEFDFSVKEEQKPTPITPIETSKPPTSTISESTPTIPKPVSPLLKTTPTKPPQPSVTAPHSENVDDNSTTSDQVPQKHKKIVRWMWAALFAGLAGFILFFVGLSFSDLPDTAALENPKSELATEVYSADGTSLGRYFTENRVPVDFSELSNYVERALVATEDERYYNHCGIDFEALGRAVIKNGLLGQRSSGGASTITQQLARLLFTGQKARGFKRILQKLKEWLIAIQLERKYTKEEIMTMYLNKFDFLYDSHGIKAASETYFGKTQDSLKIEEAAMLVGMLKNPALFNPRRRPDTVQHRREVVLKQMLKNDLLTRQMYDSLRVLPLDISNFKRKTHTQGIAQYFRMVLSQRLPEILRSDRAKKKSNGKPFDIYRDGLKIYTTIDPVMQAHAEAAMWEHMKALQKKFNRYWTSRSKSPWTYKDFETTKTEMNSRDRKKEWLIRTSERYETMRISYLQSATLTALTKEVKGLRLRDIDIKRMLKEEKQKGELTQLVSKKLISSSMAAQYRKAMKSSHWKALKKQWKTLEEEVEKSFNKAVKMRVFAYNKNGYADTTMTPLDSLIYHHNFLQIGSVGIDPHTGHVKTWIGGINQKYFAYDHATASRQVGSTFKPFVYSTAIQQLSFSPCYPVPDLPRTIFPGEKGFQVIKEWTPSNSDGKYSGETMTLKHALKKSINTVSVYLMKEIGSAEPVRDLASKMGIDVDKKHGNGQLRVPNQPSICLGSCDLTALEMASAYSAFANNGVHLKPVYISRIEDKRGRLIYDATDEQKETRALEPVPNFVMVEMLKHASGPMGLKSEVGGKTGTTNDYVDGWFVGITPELVVGTWVGGEDRWIRFLDLGNGQGSRLAKPFCQKFLKRLEEDEAAHFNTKARFHRPPGAFSIEWDCSLYERESDFGDDEYDTGNGFYEDQFGDEVRQDSTGTFEEDMFDDNE